MRKHPAIVAGVGGVLFGALTFGGINATQAAQAPDNQPVTVTNTAANAVPTAAQGTTNVAGSVNIGTLPPISGTVAVKNFPATQAVSGTVNAAQSGLWNVGISGTPQVQSGLPDNPFFTTLRVDPAVPDRSDGVFGTLAVTSITFSNFSASAVVAFVDQNAAQSGDTGCASATSNDVGHDMEFPVAPGQTLHLDFPTPVVLYGLNLPAGLACIQLHATVRANDGGALYAVVNGFQVPPTREQAP